MCGEKDLGLLIASMSPTLSEQEFVFCSVPNMQFMLNLGVSPKGMFEESEGLTLILTQSQAEIAKLAFSGTYRCITLNVHSSLEAVGLTAAVASALTKANISANVVAAYFHDHIFVPSAKAQQGLQALDELVKAHG